MARNLKGTIYFAQVASVKCHLSVAALKMFRLAAPDHFVFYLLGEPLHIQYTEVKGVCL
jgi:hypothetical protein